MPDGFNRHILDGYRGRRLGNMSDIPIFLSRQKSVSLKLHAPKTVLFADMIFTRSRKSNQQIGMIRVHIIPTQRAMFIDAVDKKVLKSIINTHPIGYD